jgi:Arm DNA-binding domain
VPKLLTNRRVAQARAKDGKRADYADSISPLRLVVQPGGAKSWAKRFRLRGRPHRYTIGAYPAITLAAARTAAKKPWKAFRSAMIRWQPSGGERLTMPRRPPRIASGSDHDLTRLENHVIIFGLQNLNVDCKRG